MQAAHTAGDVASSPALIVVHGIGRQQLGDTLHQVACGLLDVCGGAQLLDASGAAIAAKDIRERQLDRASLRQGSFVLRLYEVYWADLLPDDLVHDSFNKFNFEEVTWFGWLNWRAGLLPADAYPRWLVVLRTLQLWSLQIFASLALEVLIGFSKIRSTVLDQTVADVWHYVHSLGGELKAGSPLQGRSEQVLDRLEATWKAAAADGAGPVHLMGHSLGSVVAYHGLVRRLPATAVQRLVTVGSPLEKVCFLWAKLFPAGPAWAGDWLNVLSPADPVSGWLKRFDASGTQRVVNRRLWGLGGYGEAHVGYFRDPRVMGDVAAALGASVDGGGRVKRPSWLYRRAFDIAVPLAMIALVLAGAAVTALFFYAVVWLTGTFMGWLVGLVWSAAGPAVGHWWKVVMGWWVVVGWFLFTTKDGYNRSRVRHERRWRLRDDPPAN